MNVFEAQLQHVRERVQAEAPPGLAQRIRQWTLVGTLAAGLVLGSPDRGKAQVAVELDPLTDEVENRLQDDYTYRMVSQEVRQLEAKVLEVQEDPDATPREKQKALKLAEIFADHYLPTVRGTPRAQHAVHASMARMAAGVGDLERLTESIQALEQLEVDVPDAQLAQLLEARAQLLRDRIDQLQSRIASGSTQERLEARVQLVKHQGQLEELQQRQRRLQPQSSPRADRSR